MCLELPLNLELSSIVSRDSCFQVIDEADQNQNVAKM